MLNRLFKKLDLLIVKAFIGPFIATFFITTFVLVLQFMWLYIDDVVGKGVDTITVLRLLLYVSATVVPLALPLAVLLSSIMTLGNLGETYELVAIKSAGISLLRFLRPLFIVTLLITIVAFFFNNNILPVSNLKMNTLKYDIIVSKPAFDIKEGVFYDRIEGFVIKIGKKERDDSTIRNVVIYEQNNNGQTDNMIVADSGTMVVTPDKQSLVFTLKDGWRYQEKGDRGIQSGTELVRMGFKQYKKVMDLSSFKLNKTDDSTFRNNYSMLTMPQLRHSIDSISKIAATYTKQAGQTLTAQVKFPSYLDTTGWPEIEKIPDLTAHDPYLLSYNFARDSLQKLWTAARRAQDSLRHRQDSIDNAQKALAKTARPGQGKGNQPASGKHAPDNPTAAGKQPPPGQSPASTGTPGQSGNPSPILPGMPLPNGGIAQASTSTGTAPGASTLPKTPPTPHLVDLIPDSLRTAMVERTYNTINMAKTSMFQPVALYATEEHNILQREMAWHEKITLAVTCLVMFLIGAPLGSIIRKGGIGMPLVFAVVFFVVYFLLNNFGRKLAGSSVLTPFQGLWLAIYVLTPIGLFLVYKALHDSQLFNKEFYFRLTRKIRPLFTRKAKAKAA